MPGRKRKLVSAVSPVNDDRPEALDRVDGYRVRLSAWIDGELSTTEASDVESHVAGCAGCKTLAASLGETSRSLAAFLEREAASDPAFVARFRMRRDELSVAPWWTWRQLALRLLPLAAIVLVAAIASVLFPPRPSHSLDALELEALGTPVGFDTASAGEPVLSIALAPFPPEP
jgi:anti-sigma factor RsiW